MVTEGLNMSPLVSIIMAAYNAGSFMGASVNSILSQTYDNFELIIVDDASTDNTLDVIRLFDDPRIVLIKNKRNLKQNLSRNLAIGISKGKYIAINDADDLSMPQRLQVQVDYLESHREVDVVGSNAYLFDSMGYIIGGLVKKGTEHHELTKNIFYNTPLIHPTMMARAEWLKKYKYPDAYHGQAEDREMFLRSYAQSRFANIPQYLYAYRDPGLNPKKLMASIHHNLLMRWRNWRKYGLSVYGMLVLPFIVSARIMYYLVAAACGRSVMWAHAQPIEATDNFLKDQLLLHKLLRD